jgi:hypothetical protein
VGGQLHAGLILGLRRAGWARPWQISLDEHLLGGNAAAWAACGHCVHVQRTGPRHLGRREGCGRAAAQHSSMRRAAAGQRQALTRPRCTSASSAATLLLSARSCGSAAPQPCGSCTSCRCSASTRCRTPSRLWACEQGGGGLGVRARRGPWRVRSN